MNHHLTAEHLSASLRECIENCSDCHDACTETLAHCLSLGDKYAAAEHVVALLDCAQACDTSRDFMLRGSPIHPLVCAVCADACERCAESCESIGPDDAVIRSCAEICRRCAESCRAMAGGHAH